MEDRASRYRKIAAIVRARGETTAEDRLRQQMIRAAEIWGRLAALEERLASPPGEKADSQLVRTKTGYSN